MGLRCCAWVCTLHVWVGCVAMMCLWHVTYLAVLSRVAMRPAALTEGRRVLFFNCFCRFLWSTCHACCFWYLFCTWRRVASTFPSFVMARCLELIPCLPDSKIARRCTTYPMKSFLGRHQAAWCCAFKFASCQGDWKRSTTSGQKLITRAITMV